MFVLVLTFSPLVCVFTVGAGAGHTPLLFSWLAGQLQGEGLVYLDGRLARCCCQLEPSALHRLDREVLLAWQTQIQTVGDKAGLLPGWPSFSESLIRLPADCYESKQSEILMINCNINIMLTYEQKEFYELIKSLPFLSFSNCCWFLCINKKSKSIVNRLILIFSAVFSLLQVNNEILSLSTFSEIVSRFLKMCLI